MFNPFVESLESRRLLAGVTLLTPGWKGQITHRIPYAAAAITKPPGGPAPAPPDILKIETAPHALPPAPNAPHPIAVLNDAPPTIYDNVAFVDNYWRTDFNPNNEDHDGQSVDGAYNLNAQWLQDHWDGYYSAHLAPSGYYTGTIDYAATFGG